MGLEVSGITAIDNNSHTAFHLEAVQTLPKDNFKTLMGMFMFWHQEKPPLTKLSNIIVADTYFARNTFYLNICYRYEILILTPAFIQIPGC